MWYEGMSKLSWVVICCCMVTVNVNAEVTHVSLKKAMAANLVSVEAWSAGGYCEKSLKLDVQNNTHTDLAIDIDPGMIFAPDDSVYQNLVLLGNETLALGPAATSTVRLQTYCGKSYARGPSVGLHYHFMKQGDSLMIKTLCYVKSNNVNKHLAQSAVWMFTNGHCLNTIYWSENSRMSEEFVKYIASLKKVRIPEYFVQYKTDDAADRPVFVPGDSKVYVDMHWGAEEGYRHMYLTIYKENGDVYKRIEADKVIDKYGCTVQVVFDPKKDVKGAYYVRLTDDANRVWGQKRVLVGYSSCDLI